MATAAAPNNPRAPREIVDFPANVPVSVALKYGQGRTISNQHGERMMYSLTDGRIMFLDLEVAGQIEALGVNVQESFTITRKTDGQKGPTLNWEVARLPGEQPNGTLVVPLFTAAPTNGATPAPKLAAAAPAASPDVPRRQPGRSLVDEANSLVDELRIGPGSHTQQVPGTHQTRRGQSVAHHGLHSARPARGLDTPAAVSTRPPLPFSILPGPTMLNNRQLGAYLAWAIHGRKTEQWATTPTRRGPSRDDDYKAWIRTLPCCACGVERRSEAAHTGSDGGMRMKASDYSCVPLCSDCHTQAPGAYHRVGKRAFEVRCGISFEGVVERLRQEWGRKCA